MRRDPLLGDVVHIPSADLNLGTHPAQSTDGSGSRYYAVSGYSEDYSLRWIVAAGPTDGSGSAVSGLKTVALEATWNVRYDTSGNPIDSPHGLEVVLRTLVVE